MRVLLSSVALLFCGCGPESLPAAPSWHVQSLGLTPSASVVQVGAEVQFHSAVTWSDGGVHPAQITYSATGGSIGETGLFRADSVPGSYRVVAACSCGLADTAAVVIAAPPPPSLSQLTVLIVGLPGGASSVVAITGPGAVQRSVPLSGTIDSLEPGSYAVSAAAVVVGTSRYEPSPAEQQLVLVSGSAATITINYQQSGTSGPLPHPRVWMTPARIAHLRQQVTTNAPRWTRVRNLADGQVAKGSVVTGPDMNTIPDLCLAYLATGDARYAQRAGVLLSADAVESNDLTYDSGYGVRFQLPLVTMGLDWCYDGLTVAQRRQAATWLMNRADWVWPETNPSRAGAWGTNNVDGNYWWGFMMTGPAALAAAGDDAGTGAVSGSDRPAYHRALALAKWTTQVVPWMGAAGVGGAWLEGTNYESTWRVGAFADAFATSGTPMDGTFLAQSLLWRLHSTMPDATHKVPFGAQPRASDATVYSYDRMAALYALPFAPALAGPIYDWLDRIGGVPTTEFNETALLADELLRFDPAATPNRGVLPNGYYAAGAGYGIYRQSWTDPSATVIAFESGPAIDQNANGLMIWKGSFWISASANLFSTSGVEGATEGYNNLTVGGQGQRSIAGNGGTMAPPEFSPTLVRFEGQAKASYGYQNEWVSTRFVDDYRRVVTYLPIEDVIVVVDRATAKNPGDAKVWYWHSKHPAIIAGNTFTLRNPGGDQRCIGTVHHPTAVLGTRAYTLGGSPGSVTSHAVTVSMSGNATDQVITIFQCGAPVPVTVTPGVITVAGRAVIP